MPRTANADDSPKTLTLCRPDALAHVSFAQFFATIGRLFVVVDLSYLFSQRRHQLHYRFEPLSAVASLFDHLVPPAFTVAEPGRLGNPAQGVLANLFWGLQILALNVAFKSKLIGLG